MQEALGPITCPLSARMMKGGRKMLLGRWHIVPSLRGRLWGVNLTLIHPSLQKSLGKDCHDPARGWSSSSAWLGLIVQELRKIRAQTPRISLPDRTGGQGPPRISQSLFCVNPVTLAWNYSPLFPLLSLTVWLMFLSSLQSAQGRRLQEASPEPHPESGALLSDPTDPCPSFSLGCASMC